MLRSFWSVYKDKVQLTTLLGLSSALSVALVLARIFYSGWPTYAFLVKNLILAWIPLCIALVLWAIDRKGALSKVSFIVLASMWLAFFPNAPYIITDLVHLGPRAPVPLWYDLLLIFSCAWNGLIVGFVSLRLVQSVTARFCGTVASWLLVPCALVASGFGIYLGRFLRWNSWDFLTNPALLMADIVDRVANPLAHPHTFAMTILFAAFLMVAYATILMLTEMRWQKEPVPEAIVETPSRTNRFP